MKRSKVNRAKKANAPRGGSIIINNLRLTNAIHVVNVSDIGSLDVNDVVVKGVHEAFLLRNIDNVRITNYREENIGDRS